MNLNFEKIITFPFKEKDWKRPFWTIAIAYLLTYGLMTLTWLPVQFMPVFTGDDFNVALPFIVLFMGVAAVLWLLLIPVSFYIYGYQFKLYNYVRRSEKNLPQHTDLSKTLIYGLKAWVVNMVYMLPVIAIFVILAVILAVVMSLLAVQNLSSEIALLTFAISAILGLVLLAGSFLIALFVVPAANYEFLKTGSINAALKVQRVWEYVKFAWKDLLVAAAIVFAIAMIAGFATAVVFCVSFLLQPLMYAYLMFVTAMVYGEVYKVLDKKFK